MNKPEKKELTVHGHEYCPECEKKGYNQACDDWEKYHKECIQNSATFKRFHMESLPSEEEITEIMVREIAKQMKPPVTFDDKVYQEIMGVFAPKSIKDLAKAISKRIRSNHEV